MIKRKTLEKPSDVVLPNFKKITGEKEEKEKVPVQKKSAGFKVFTLNLPESVNEEFMSFYRNYKLASQIYELSFTQFFERSVIFYSEAIKKEGFYMSVPESFVKNVLQKTGRRRFREPDVEKKIGNNIHFSTEIYNIFLDITYSYAIKKDTEFADVYSLSYMANKILTFLKDNQDKFYLHKF
jgi:hypothetical protein